jgi:hypothetical protein
LTDSPLLAARERVRPFLLPTLADLPAQEHNTESFQSKKSANALALARASLRVTSEVTPAINELVESVCRRLDAPRQAIDAYVYPSAELSAFCFLDNHPVIVGLSSQLTQSLEGDELAFVLGHEIGHALFRETQYFVADARSLEDQVYARSIELSVDRIGLLASGNNDAALRAILKTLSGLGAQHLRFDFSHYMSEARAVVSETVSEQQLWSSHPPLAERFRALVSFSMSDVYLKASGRRESDGVPIEQTNRQLASGPNSMVDAAAKRLIEQQLYDVALWFVTFAVTNKKKVNLTGIREHTGIDLRREDIEKAVRLMEGVETQEQQKLCQDRIAEELTKAFALAPRATNKAVQAFQREFPDIRIQVHAIR